MRIKTNEEQELEKKEEKRSTHLRRHIRADAGCVVNMVIRMVLTQNVPNMVNSLENVGIVDQKGHKACECDKLKEDMIAKRKSEKAKFAIGTDSDNESIGDFDDDIFGLAL